MSKTRRICIIGAGAAGLSTAWYLKQAGYTNVTVLEKLDRVGGMCFSITYGEDSFDLGANYVTSDYREVRKLARSLGAKMHTDTAFQNQVSLDVETGRIGSTTAIVNAGYSFLSFGISVLRYFWNQFKFRKVVSRPNMAGLSDYPELQMSFGDFLEKNGMLPLWKVLMLPITAMGYGQLGDIPAAYALRYVDASRFFSLLLTGLKIPQNWPKRFNDGFQRLWDRVAWGLDVELSVDVRKVERADGKVTVHYSDSDNREHERQFDTLVVACPFDLALDFLDARPLEKQLFSADVIHYNQFHNTTAITEDFPYQVVNELMLPNLPHSPPGHGVFPADDGHPWIFGKQEVSSELTLFYSSVATGTKQEEVKKRIIEDCDLTFSASGQGKFVRWHEYRNWKRYFPHVTVQDMYDFQGSGKGYYDVFESLQGKDDTFYVGGLLSFELVESIMQYTRNLVDKRF